MSEQIKDGGPAFPGEKNIRFGQTNDCNEGMTLRDYFAAKAMQGWLANGPTIAGKKVDNTAESAEKLSAASYLFADAMLAAREAKS